MEVDTHMAGLRFVELPTGVHQKMDDTWGQLNQLNPEKNISIICSDQQLKEINYIN